MKHRQYTRKKKFGVLLCFILCLSLTAAGLLGLYYVNNFTRYLFSKTELLECRSFEDTETLERKVLADTEKLLWYVQAGQIFSGTDQENRHRPLYLVQLGEERYLFTLSDLTNAYNAYAQAEAQNTGDIPSAIVLDSGDILIFDREQELLLLYDYVYQEDENRPCDLPSLYQRGVKILQEYYAFRDSMEEERTNLGFVFYAVSEAGEKTVVSTNRSRTANGLETAEASIEALKELGRYLEFDHLGHHLTSDFVKTDIRSFGIEALDSVDSGQGFSFVVGLDMSYPVRDEYASMSSEYTACRPILLASIPAILLGIIGSLVCFVYLLASVGHQEDFDEIRLDRFDQWPTEPSAILVFGGILAFNWLCGFCARLFAGYFFTSNLIHYVVQAFSVVLSAIIGMVGFFSLVKRLKAGVLWKHSLLRKLFAWIGRFFATMLQDKDSSIRVILIVLIYWLVTIPLALNIGAHFTLMPRWRLALELFLFLLVQISAAGAIIWVYLKRKVIQEGVWEITRGNLEYEIDPEGMFPGDRQLAEGINNIGAGLQEALDAAVRSERMKADLITNVSHDIKTPLTSIINYVNLMKRQHTDDPVMARYISILDEKSNRLRVLTEDLVEASRASSGNVQLVMEPLNYVELVRQACGEFEERFEERDLKMVVSFPEKPARILADGRRLWRILENLFVNAYKYAMPGTRVYISVEEDFGFAAFTMKNISENPLNTNPVELMERFTRGDSSRSTEGSGLGLSIAKDLTELMGGFFDLYLNGDLYQVTVQFDVYKEPSGPVPEAEEIPSSEAPDSDMGTIE